jgi:hypothetical protein
MRSVSTPCCVSTWRYQPEFIGDISLIPSGLRNWVALYVDLGATAADFFSSPSALQCSSTSLLQPATAALAALSLPCLVMHAGV